VAYDPREDPPRILVQARECCEALGKVVLSNAVEERVDRSLPRREPYFLDRDAIDRPFGREGAKLSRLLRKNEEVAIAS